MKSFSFIATQDSSSSTTAILIKNSEIPESTENNM